MSAPARYYDLVFLGVALVIAVLHRMAWSDFPPDVDPINFTLALQQFAPAFDAPHPPGYPLFVFSARALSLLVGDSHAYQCLNLLLLLGSGWNLYTLCKHFHAQLLGLAAAILIMTHPLAWSATVIAECYITDMFFATAIAAYTLTSGANNLVFLLGGFLIFFALGMVRPVSGVLLLPLALIGTYIRSQSKRLPIILTGLALLAIALAYLSTALLAGGFELYRSAASRVMGGAFKTSSVFGGAAVSAHVKMLAHLLAWLALLALPAALGLAFLSWRKSLHLAVSQQIQWLLVGAFWLLPALLFYAGIYYLKPTYQLIYLPCLLLPVAWVLVGRNSFIKPSWGKGILLGLVGLQLAVFWVPIPHLPHSFSRLTRTYIIQQDRAWMDLQEALAQYHDHPALLLVWVSHPSLPVYALRLLNWQTPVAVVSSTHSQLTYLVPKTMIWLPAKDSASSIDSSSEGAVLVTEQAGKSVVKYVPFTTPQARQLQDLLKPAM